jgi:hypothetical protein
MTVEELALQLDLQVHEVLALCTVAGVKGKGPGSDLSDRDVRRVNDVLEGRIQIPELKATPKSSEPTSHLFRNVLIVVVIGVVAWVGFVVFSFVNRPTEINVRSGQCFESPGLFGSTLEPVSCDEPHDYKAYATIDLDEVFADWPGVDAVEEHARKRCEVLAESTGTTDYAIYYFGPATQRAWGNAGSHRIVCAVSD